MDENLDEKQEEGEDVVFEDEEETSNPQALIKKLRTKLRASEKERLEFLTGWQKTKADFVNLRKRDEEERESFLKLANESLILEFLPVLDSVELAQRDQSAWEALPGDWRKGIESIFTQLKNILKKSGVEEIEAINKTLDPRFHEAIGTVSTEDKGRDHTVAEVFQTGYMYQGKVLRPARVRVYEYAEK